ncbi:MAG: hypothetical protein JWM39_442 [Parcubacteria group bacterium]|nr:hypothetical protein [Parcubacteria group bacterium]
MADEKLLEQILKERGAGKSEEALHEELKKDGWPEADIYGAFAVAKLRSNPMTASRLAPPAVAPRRSKGNLVFQILIVIVLLVSAPAVFGFVTGTVLPAITAQANGTATSTSLATLGQSIFGIVPLIPVKGSGTGSIFSAPASKSSGSSAAVSHSTITTQPTAATPAPNAGAPITTQTQTTVPVVTTTQTPFSVPDQAPVVTVPNPVVPVTPVVTPPVVPVVPVTPVTPVVPVVPVVPPVASLATATDTPSLLKALKAAKPGDTITLASNTYSGLGTIANLNFSSPVTVTSYDTSHKAILTNFSMMRVNGLSFTNLEFSNQTPTAFTVNTSSSQNIRFDSDYIHGSLDGNSDDDGGGLGFLDTSNVTVSNSTLEQLRQGISNGANVTPSVSNITITGNTIKGMEKSGMVFAGASNVTVTGNSISDIEVVPPDHPDGMQFFTTGTTVAAHDITVANNVIVKGKGQAAQGIFFRDQVGTLPYQNVHIDNNLIIDTGYGGVYAEGVGSGELSGNFLTSEPGSTNNTFFLVQNGGTIAATNNTATAISFDNVTNLTQSGNATTTPVTDQGLQAMRDWSQSHPASAAQLAPFIGALSIADSHSMLASAEAALASALHYLLGLLRL